ncbi:MAG: HEAT repeat domain-containing protein [Methanobrevibacter sp.]|nr:HEAT repeat domain-containing protein [Methanobrevibacter sp.]
MSIINYDLDEEYRNALDKEADKESRLFSISLLDGFHPLDELVLDEDEDVDIRIAALDCLDIFGFTLYELDIDELQNDLALAVIERLDSESKLKDIALNHPSLDYRLKAVENKHLKDEETLKQIIENETVSQLRAAAAKHPSLNDSEFLEKIALNDDDVYVRQAAVSNYSTKDIPTLKKIITDDEDIVRISALENLVFKYNLFYPYSNKKYNFKRKFNEIGQSMINFIDESYVPKEMDDWELDDLMDFDLLNGIYYNSANENYGLLRDDLISIFNKILFYFEKYNPFNETEKDDSLIKRLYGDLNPVYGDRRSLVLYKLKYDDRIGNLKYHLDGLHDLDINLDNLNTTDDNQSSDKLIEESFFIDLAYNDSNEEMVKLAIEAISDNSVLMDFIENGKTGDIKKTAIKKSTDLPSLVDLAIGQIDKDIQEAKFFDDDWLCDYVSDDLDYFHYMSFDTYAFYSHDLKYIDRLFDNRLESFYYDKIAEHYYKDAFSYCLFKKIQNYFDLIYILKNTRSFVLRDLIIYKIENPIVLSDIALNGIDERIRYIAFGRIKSKAILKMVYLKTDDFRIKLLYLSKATDNDVLEEAFLREENEVLRKSILDNNNFIISPRIIEFCINDDSKISSYAENKFAEQFVNYRLMNKKFLK